MESKLTVVEEQTLMKIKKQWDNHEMLNDVNYFDWSNALTERVRSIASSQQQCTRIDWCLIDNEIWNTLPQHRKGEIIGSAFYKNYQVGEMQKLRDQIGELKYKKK